MDELLNELKAAYGEGAEWKKSTCSTENRMGKKFGIFSCDKNTKEKEERNNAYYKPFACINEQSN